MDNVSIESLVAVNKIPMGASIFNVSRDPLKTSERYRETDDIAVISELNRLGWFATGYKQTRSRDAERGIYKSYLAMYENTNLPATPEGKIRLMQRNSKDGSTKAEFFLGLYRMLCENQLIVSNHLFEPIKIRHSGDLPGQILSVVDKLLVTGNEVFSRISDMQAKIITQEQSLYLAEKAINLRFDEETAKTISPLLMLKPRRDADVGNSLWKVLNVVQENIVQGGAYGATTKKGTPRKARAIKNIALDLKVNQGVWSLAEEFLQ